MHTSILPKLFISISFKVRKPKGMAERSVDKQLDKHEYLRSG